ncbi:Synaptotagmin-like protein 1 [Heterocephalus glaber]|uniref:Synaptotagmin-like protein 1 n=1 Tax=Heterocephalus glaber TaxID=10181 RepID=G5AUT3_HETGA|nr:Synaptotagmin-like protein 1 [Heterocephalus glaber]
MLCSREETDLTIGLPPGSHLCPAGARLQLMPQRDHPSQERLWALSSLPMAHDPEPDAEGLLDLSFLTEEEQEAIADVLTRDARLRQLDEGRVSKLRASLADPGQLKTLTGDWFQEARSQRHQHTHFGSDLVRASIRRKKSSRGDQPLGSDREAEAAGKETEEEIEPRLPTEEEAPQERRGEIHVSDHEEEPQIQEAPGPGGAQVEAEQAVPEPQPKPLPETRKEPLPAAQVQVASETLENGEAPGPSPSLDRMLSSSSSVSSLSSSTLSGSLMSLSGEVEGGTLQVCGSLNFALRYDPGARELRVHVIQCQGLAAARRSDPYVKSYLHPDKQSKRKTAVKKRNLNPVFNEILRYSVPKDELSGRVLSLSVWHRESLGRNIFLGEVEVPLDTWNWDSGPTWLPLQPRAPPSPKELPSRGFLSLSLKYVPAGSEGGGQPVSGELHFWVKEAQNLMPLRSGSPDTFVQCSVLPDDSRAGRQRTRVVRHSFSPVFNHTMVYDGFGPADLRQACAELSLWDHEALASRQLGGTRLSLGTGSSYGLQVPWMDSTPEEKRLWQTLLERPCEWVDGLLPLRTNLVPRA